MLEIRTIAAGIENCDALDTLREIGCEYGQGYLFSQPANDRVSTWWSHSFPATDRPVGSGPMILTFADISGDAFLTGDGDQIRDHHK
jgi:predicted signal transduction protein with EAL and GGDEF domain